MKTLKSSVPKVVAITGVFFLFAVLSVETKAAGRGGTRPYHIIRPDADGCTEGFASCRRTLASRTLPYWDGIRSQPNPGTQGLGRRRSAGFAGDPDRPYIVGSRRLGQPPVSSQIISPRDTASGHTTEIRSRIPRRR